jgi:sulfonate transport system substrate-binding protein
MRCRTANRPDDADAVAAAIRICLLKRYAVELHPITDDVVAKQQQVADSFTELKLIPGKNTVSDYIWTAPTR